MTKELKTFLESVVAKKVINTTNRTFIFNVKSECETRMVETGVFNGTESLIRVTEFYSDKTFNDYVFTILNGNGKEKSWHTGANCNDIISFNTKKQERLISEAVKEKFDRGFGN